MQHLQDCQLNIPLPLSHETDQPVSCVCSPSLWKKKEEEKKGEKEREFEIDRVISYYDDSDHPAKCPKTKVL